MMANYFLSSSSSSAVGRMGRKKEEGGKECGGVEVDCSLSRTAHKWSARFQDQTREDAREGREGGTREGGRVFCHTCQTFIPTGWGRTVIQSVSRDKSNSLRPSTTLFAPPGGSERVSHACTLGGRGNGERAPMRYIASDAIDAFEVRAVFCSMRRQLPFFLAQ